ncbi:efflux RND transporter periplasmic adaptor subunit [Vibrio sp. JPW-9-11-11]|uniref:efflux RND transporter periplasmic adaptor subunit n=1 Tax=Vibrio sp. JPW-9-11-11 TaxID=1416532 RepID=UPI00159466A2|nr:efflux RND transporter periplasmic adaptor subunit [Vibrio sp. JPW-9-11-11]NVD07977.1 efflux RND transporter periplasmic adaptor subunit [Vibrio sp. JPW-9-11-11]
MKWIGWNIALMGLVVSHANAQQNEQLYTVSREPLAQIIHLDGVVQPVNQGTVAAQTSGRVVGLYVDVNDYVKQGTVLLEISDVQQSASLDAAKAQLVSATAQNREAQSQLKRYQQLFPKGAISQDQMDSAEARARSAAAAVKSAQASVAQAKESLGYTNVTAPYDGIVTKRHVQLGETVAPGTPLLSGFALNLLRVETDIAQRHQPVVNEIEQFTVLGANGERITPTDMSLFQYADPQSHTFKVRLQLPENSATFVPGMWVKTEFHYGDRETLLIPESAVVRRGELSSVFRIDQQHRVLNPVRLGQTYGEYVEVLSGLEEGDVIATTALAMEGE